MTILEILGTALSIFLSYMLGMYITYLFLLLCEGRYLERKFEINPWYIFVILFWPVLLLIHIIFIVVGKRVLLEFLAIHNKTKEVIIKWNEQLRSKK